VCFDFLCAPFLKHFLFWEELSEVWSKMCIGVYVKYPLVLSGFNETWIFSIDFRKKHIHISNFMKIHPVGAGFLHAGGRTDMNLRVAFRDIANALKN
jgi:hypothetical protein